MNTTDYFWASVNHLIRKYYIHISWTEGGKGKKTVWVIKLSLMTSSHTSVERRQGQQQFCNIITIIYIATTSQQEGGRCVCLFLEGFLRVHREWGQVQKREEDVVCREPVVLWLSVERDELCLSAARRSLRNLLLLLGWLLLLGATRRGHLARKKVKQDIKAGENNKVVYSSSGDLLTWWQTCWYMGCWPGM